MRSVPPLPRWLGVLGVLPQIALVAALYAGPPEWREPVQMLIAMFAAVTLGLTGGSWCGIAAGAPAAERRQSLGWLWVAAGLAAAVGMACLVALVLGGFGPEPVLVMLGSAQLLTMGVDTRLGALAPRWWPAHRVPMSIAQSALTLVAAFA
ncbi:DUF3429 domain-containing protein [Qipengyuania marisflavi]|uniref:DUF3429 domain-containing protein n=1 Tax=Qipengyuania marisflavi TaxID=2486356 RepID=A0A5S3P239_9SPHN|nr:DUF3429 domain-containing protein [Qipengyuania marisflavi]TMM46719.1 DUF3429 domain-containing protein [Qipengyuania marisflavi]